MPGANGHQVRLQYMAPYAYWKRNTRGRGFLTATCLVCLWGTSTEPHRDENGRLDTLTEDDVRRLVDEHEHKQA